MAFLNQLTPVKANMIRGVPDQNLGEATNIYPTFDIKVEPEQALDGNITFSRSTSGYRRNALGLLESVAADGQRHDYDPGTGEYLGLLIEQAATNLMRYSEDFGNATWGKTSVAVTANSANAPDGQQTADFVENSGSSVSLIHQAYTVTPSSTNKYFASVFVKKGTSSDVTLNAYYSGVSENNVTFNFDTEELLGVPTGSKTIKEKYPNGWFRIGYEMPVDGTGAATTIVFRIWPNGRGSSSTTGSYLWGAQLELDINASSYIQTTSATVTRARDVFEVANAAFSYDWYNNLEGTAYCEMKFAEREVEEHVFSLFGDFSNFFLLKGQADDSTGVALRFISGGVDEINQVISVNKEKFNKYAFSYKSGEQKVAIAGELKYTGSISNDYPAAPKAEFGAISGSSGLNGWFKQLAYFPKSLSNDQIKIITE